MEITDRTTSTDPLGSAHPRRRRHGGTVRLLLACSALLLTAMLAAGCGSSSSGSSVAHVQPGTTTKTGAASAGEPNLLALAECMRKHGVPNFPDPDGSGQLDLSGLNPESPTFQAAASACRSFGGVTPKQITQTAQIQQEQLNLAECMRSHGVPNYPDGPINKSSGIDESSPVFQRAFQACSKNLSGGKAPGPGGQVPVTPGE